MSFLHQFCHHSSPTPEKWGHFLIQQEYPQNVKKITYMYTSKSQTVHPSQCTCPKVLFLSKGMQNFGFSLEINLTQIFA